MDYFGYFSSVCILIGLVQLLSAANVEVNYEPMVAFICDRPAMHRGVNGWVPDKSQDCPDTLEQVLDYCKKVYPDHNISNVVESSRFYDIENWPMGNAGRKHTHHVRPFRCLVGGFQSDALLVPQHCEFDHRHDITMCKEFSHWNRVADNACTDKGMHLESFGMLLYCNQLGHFNGVEYVCCPNPSQPRVQPEPEGDDKPDKWGQDQEDSAVSSDEEDDDDESDEEEDSDESDDSDESYDSSDESASNEIPDENSADLYEAYLRGLKFPAEFDNEHKKYLKAKERMKMNQRKKEAKLLQEWEKAREHVNEVRKTDPKAANKMNEEIALRFKDLYASFKKEDASEMMQLMALHQQHIQANLNEKKRLAMDKYMQALDDGEISKVTKYLQNYINAEEKDRMHTVNHFQHIRYSAPKEALRIHRHIIYHLKLSEMRIDQAMDMLTHYPNIEPVVRPGIEEYLKRYDTIATDIKNLVLPVPEVEEEEDEVADSSSSSSEEESTDSDDSTESASTSDSAYSDDDRTDFDSSSEEVDRSTENQIPLDDASTIIDDEVQEDEHSYERNHHFVANALSDRQHASQGLTSHAESSSQVASTVGIALGSVSVFVIIVVAAMMIKRNQSRQSVSHGYVEVDPSASPEERHLANMQMNGYENPTYKYFEVQNNPKA